MCAPLDEHAALYYNIVAIEYAFYVLRKEPRGKRVRIPRGPATVFGELFRWSTGRKAGKERNAAMIHKSGDLHKIA